MKKLYRKIKRLIREAKYIRWCGLKKWLGASAAVIAAGAVIALLLTAFDVVSSYIVTLPGKFIPDILPVQPVQILLFITAILLGVLCIIKSSRGDDVIRGLSSSGSKLFQISKKDRGDIFIIRIIWGLTILLFVLLILSATV